MPYIKQSDRRELNELIDALALKLHVPGKVNMNADDYGDMAGKLNYIVSRLLLACIGTVRYWKIALFCGVLSNITSEFYRKLAAPYEDEKIKENGDLPWGLY